MTLWPRPLAARCALAMFAALGIYGSLLGWGTDRDSIRVVRSAVALLHGHYERSRSFGFPLHEAASAALYAVGGIAAVNLGSLAATLLGLCLALRIASRLAPDRVVLAALALGFSPLLLVNAASAIDFGWDFAAGMALLEAALMLLASGSAGALAYYGGATLALLLLRPDSVLFAAAITLAVLAVDRRVFWRAAALCCAAGLAALAIYVGLNGAGMFATAVSSTRPFAARFGRAAIMLSAVLGPGGALTLFLLARHGAGQGSMALLRRAAVLSWLFYLPRFAVLPDQADYLILPVELTLLLGALSLKLAVARTCVVLTCLPSLATLSLLQRAPDTGALSPHIALQPGALPQDWTARRFAQRMQAPGMASFVAARLPGAAPGIQLAPDTYLPGYVTQNQDLVTGQDQLYHLIDTHAGTTALATVPRYFYQSIWACNVPLGPTIGWRAWEAPTRAQAMEGLRCRRVEN